ncbi:MAG TPA: methionine ABC transporter ATP-binding protein [Acholeplasmataceae bacterium]|nr:methionine ABC transporter ATP-binding protein [Acholeplasmataceae bacterium]
MIQIEHVSQRYKQQKEDFYALNDVSLRIDSHTNIGIVGYSGAGKSTLVRLINGLIKPTQGGVYVDGIDLNTLTKKELDRMRMKIGMVFQHFNLLSSQTVFNNVKIALKIAGYEKDQIDARVHEVLEMVGLSDKAMSYPRNLSGGEKQRVGIARGIANHPTYLLCDEMTSALDHKTDKDILAVLKEIQKKEKMSIIFISHQLDMVREICDEIVVMEKGKIVESKKTKDLFIEPKSHAAQSLIESYQVIESLRGSDRYVLTYTKDALHQSILSDAIKAFEIDLSIIYALTLPMGLDTIGYLVVEMKGNRLQEACEFITSKEVHIRRLSEEKIYDNV